MLIILEYKQNHSGHAQSCLIKKNILHFRKASRIWLFKRNVRGFFTVKLHETYSNRNMSEQVKLEGATHPLRFPLLQYISV